MKVLPDNIFDVVAGAAGTLGTFVSVTVLWVAGSIRRDMKRRIMLPDRARDLRYYADVLMLLASEPSATLEPIRERSLAQIDGCLSTLRNYELRANHIGDVDTMQHAIHKFKRPNSDMNLNSLTHELYKFIEIIEDHIRQVG